MSNKKWYDIGLNVLLNRDSDSDSGHVVESRVISQAKLNRGPVTVAVYEDFVRAVSDAFPNYEFSSAIYEAGSTATLWVTDKKTGFRKIYTIDYANDGIYSHDSGMKVCPFNKDAFIAYLAKNFNLITISKKQDSSRDSQIEIEASSDTDFFSGGYDEEEFD